MRELFGQPSAVGMPGILVFVIGGTLFCLAVIRTRLRSGAGEAGASRSSLSILGILFQMAGIAVAGMGPPRIALAPATPAALGEAALVALLIGSALFLFLAATRAMGANWSLVARTRADHSLVTGGIFARLRHPIYTAMFLFMAALAAAFGHLAQLIPAIPIFALGTAIRVREEERLLRARFGTGYDDYAPQVKRFVPGIF